MVVGEVSVDIFEDLQHRNNFLLQYFYGFATIAKYVCHWEGEFSDEFPVDVSNDIYFCYKGTIFCYALSSVVSGELVRPASSASFLYFVGQLFFTTLNLYCSKIKPGLKK
jgi:hypothetical protein